MANEPSKPIEPISVSTINTERQMACIRFSPCGKLLFAAGRDGKIHRWNIDVAPPKADDVDAALDQAKTDQKKKPDPKAKPPEIVFPELPVIAGHDGWVTSLAFHPREPRLFSADSWGRLSCWPYQAEAPQATWSVASAHDGWLRQLAITTDGDRLATCGFDKTVRIWSTADGKKLQELAHGEDVLSVAFHPDGKSLVAGDLRGVVKQWDLTENKVVREFDAKVFYMLSFIQDVGGVRTLVFDPEGKTLAVGGAQPAGGGFVQASPLVKFFQWSDGKELPMLKLGDNTEGYVHEVAHHPDGFWMGVCSGQPGKGKFFLHRVDEANPFTSKPLTNCHSVAIHPNGVRFAVVSNAGTFGQQKSMARQGIYPGNTSPINFYDLPAKS